MFIYETLAKLDIQNISTGNYSLTLWYGDPSSKKSDPNAKCELSSFAVMCSTEGGYSKRGTVCIRDQEDENEEARGIDLVRLIAGLSVGALAVGALVPLFRLVYKVRCSLKLGFNCFCCIRASFRCIRSIAVAYASLLWTSTPLLLFSLFF